jgi:hypothetical protein
MAETAGRRGDEMAGQEKPVGGMYWKTIARDRFARAALPDRPQVAEAAHELTDVALFAPRARTVGARLQHYEQAVVPLVYGAVDLAPAPSIEPAEVVDSHPPPSLENCRSPIFHEGPGDVAH